MGECNSIPFIRNLKQALSPVAVPSPPSSPLEVVSSDCLYCILQLSYLHDMYPHWVLSTVDIVLIFFLVLLSSTRMGLCLTMSTNQVWTRPLGPVIVGVNCKLIVSVQGEAPAPQTCVCDGRRARAKTLIWVPGSLVPRPHPSRGGKGTGLRPRVRMWPTDSTHSRFYVFCAFPCAVAMEAVNEDEVQMMVYKGMTHKQISAELQIRFPGTRGFSERTVRRFWHGIHKPRGLKLDQLVEEATQEVSKLRVDRYTC